MSSLPRRKDSGKRLSRSSKQSFAKSASHNEPTIQKTTLSFSHPVHPEALACRIRAGSFDFRYEGRGRRFEPEKWFKRKPENQFCCEGYPDDYDKTWTHLTCPALCRCPDTGSPGIAKEHPLDPLIIAVSAAEGGPTSTSTAAFGVWFGDGAPTLTDGGINLSEGDNIADSKEEAEVGAVYVALKMYQSFVKDGRHKRDSAIIIKSDSSYLVDGICDHIMRWQQNGWNYADGVPIKPQHLWAHLEEEIHKVEKRGLTRVMFWHVPQEWNTRAHALARQSLGNDEDKKDHLTIKEAQRRYEEERDAWLAAYVQQCRAKKEIQPN